MPPEGYVPAWERDFWDTLMEDQGVHFRTTTDACGCGLCAGAYDHADKIPDQPFVSPYATDDMLVGEIVEDDQPCITA